MQNIICLKTLWNAYESYQKFEGRIAREERNLQRTKSQQEQAEIRASNIREEMKHDSAMLNEELKSSQWKLERRDLEECEALQQRLLSSSWNLLRKYNLPDSYRLTQNILKNYYKALNEPDPSKKLRMLRVLEDEFAVYPPYWYYRARTAEEANNEREAENSFRKFGEVWRPVLRRDPYKVEAEKFRIRQFAKDDPEKHRQEILDALDVIRANTPKEDWANNLFAGIAFFVMGDHEQGIECLELNIDFEYEHDISSALLASMRQGALNSSSAQDAVRTLKLGELVNGMNETDKATATALADFFDGIKGARENLERMSRTANNPVIFHALRIAEQSGKNDFSRVMEYVNAHGRLKDKINDAYASVMPIVKQYAEDGNDAAKVFEADALMFGWGVEQDAEKAGKIFGELAGKGNAYAQGVMLQRYFAGQEYLSAKKETQQEPSAKKETQQELEALYQEGYKCYFGSGREVNTAIAVEFFTRAAEGGHSNAQYYLAICYRYGNGVSKNLEKARYWFGKAAEQGDRAARNALNELNKQGF